MVGRLRTVHLGGTERSGDGCGECTGPYFGHLWTSAGCRPASARSFWSTGWYRFGFCGGVGFGCERLGDISLTGTQVGQPARLVERFANQPFCLCGVGDGALSVPGRVAQPSPQSIRAPAMARSRVVQRVRSGERGNSADSRQRSGERSGDNKSRLPPISARTGRSVPGTRSSSTRQCGEKLLPPSRCSWDCTQQTASSFSRQQQACVM